MGAWVRTVTFRTVQLAVSAMYTFPAPSTATPCGPLSVAIVGSPPSPLVPAAPVPATVNMIPLGAILRTCVVAQIGGQIGA